MKVFDCIIVHHEIDILKLRFNVLNDVVDHFVITEGNSTFSGKPKRRFFLENKDEFKEWSHKIIYNEIQIPEELQNPWDREIYSRNSSFYKIKDIASDKDLILTSDADEIPNPEVIRLKDRWYKENVLFTFKMKMYYYYINNLANENWYGTRGCSFSLLRQKTIDDIREATEDLSKISGPIIDKAGWHFSYCGGSQQIKQKIESFCDTNLNNDHVKNSIEENVKNNKDIFFRGIRYIPVPLDNTYPKYILDNKDKLKHLIKL